VHRLQTERREAEARAEERQRARIRLNEQRRADKLATARARADERARRTALEKRRRMATVAREREFNGTWLYYIVVVVLMCLAFLDFYRCCFDVLGFLGSLYRCCFDVLGFLGFLSLLILMCLADDIYHCCGCFDVLGDRVEKARVQR
jgi:hypothetical protein